jgi:hypothetical protein
MVGIAAARFVIAAKNFAREDLRPGTGSRIDIAFAGLVVLLGRALFLSTHTFVTKLRRTFESDSRHSSEMK